MPKEWTVLSSQYVLNNAWLRVREDRCLTGHGNVVDAYYVIERFDFVMVVGLTESGEVVLVRQYKHGCGEIVCECPAGYIHPGEDPAEAAKRELHEETGYEATSIELLGSLFASPSTSTHRMYLYLCQGMRKVGEQVLDPAEDIEVMLVDFEEAMARVRRNELVADAASTAALHLAEGRLRERV